MHEPQQKTLKWVLENVASLAIAFVIVFMIRSSVIEAFKIPSGSMIPTLLIGDHIFVNKMAYGFKLPFSEYFADEPFYLVKGDPPKRGDVIVFKYPKDESIFFIKRVIALPGDMVEMRDKRVYINGKPVERKPVTEEERKQILSPLEEPRYPLDTLQVFHESLDREPFTSMIDQANFTSENFGVQKVPQDAVFVMGDNRDSSNDSRYWGFVPMRNIRGRAVVIWLSIWFDWENRDGTFRPSRIGTLIH